MFALIAKHPSIPVKQFPALVEKCQDIGYPNVSRHRLPLRPDFVNRHKLLYQ